MTRTKRIRLHAQKQPCGAAGSRRRPQPGEVIELRSGTRLRRGPGSPIGVMTCVGPVRVLVVGFNEHLDWAFVITSTIQMGWVGVKELSWVWATQP